MLKKISTFLNNTAGGILPAMGLLVVPLTIAAGVAIDYTRYVNMKNDIQVSLDAAGLATSAYLNSTDFKIPSNITSSTAVAAYKQTQGQQYATNFFLANVDDNISPSDYTLNVLVSRNGTGEETVRINSSITYDTIFGQIHRGGQSNFYTDILTADLESVIVLGNRTIEVALVMDNSGSMGNTPSGGSTTKVASMRTAALKLVSDLYDSAQGSTLVDPVKFSLVPFAGMVNVGPLGDSNLDGNFIDVNGFNPANNENLDWDDTYRTNQSITKPFNNHVVKVGNDFKSRLDVFEMLNEDWEGCVEMRPWPHNVLDTYVSNQSTSYSVINNSLDGDGDGTSDGAKALFVPAFAPDEPDNEFAKDYDPGSHSSRKRSYAYGVDHDNDDDGYWNSYLYDFRDHNVSNTSKHIQLYTNDQAELVTTGNNPNGSGNGSISNTATNERDSVRQINRTNWMFKYQSNVKIKNYGSWSGPNYGCTSKKITPLTATKSTVDAAINDMIASGTTNIQQGLTWGWRTLSEGLPFDQGRTKADRVNLKFIILLTDGNNFYDDDGDSTPNQSEYGAWGYARADSHSLKHAISNEATHNRMSEGMASGDLANTIYAGSTYDLTPNNSTEFNLLMNAHTAQACENVKADGISIYTIVYDLNDTATENLMQACAGSGVINNSNVIAGVEFYHEASGANLDDTFAEIASSISAIRIAY